MKKLNDEGLKKLSQEEVKQINGGSDWRDSINGLIDKANDWLEERHAPVCISHI